MDPPALQSVTQTWSDVAEKLRQEYHFLQKIRLHADKNANPEPVPDLVQIMGIAAYRTMDSTDPISLAITIPRLSSFALWIAIVASLAAMEGEFETSGSLPQHLKTGNMLLDGDRIVDVLCERDGRIFFTMARGGIHTSSIPIEQRLRLQPTTSDRQPDSLRPVDHVPPIDILDNLLGIRSLGNRSVFTNKVIVVGRTNRMQPLLNTLVSCQGLSSFHKSQIRDVLQCMRLSRNGNLKAVSAGLRAAEPTVMIASDLTVVRDHIRRTGSKPLVVVDGAQFWRDRDEAISSIMSAGGKLIFCLEHHEIPELPKRSDAIIWGWESSDLASLGQATQPKNPGVFSTILRAVDAYSRRIINAQECHDDTIERAYDQLTVVERLMNEDSRIDVQRALFDFFLSAARSCCPVYENDDTEVEFERRIQHAWDLVNEHKWEFTADATSEIKTLFELFREIMDRSDTAKNGKIWAVERLLRGTFPETITIVTSGRWEATYAWNYFDGRISLTAGRVQFCHHTQVESIKYTDNLVICGWLNSQRMQHLLSSAVSPNITVLLYPFEERWYTAAEGHWLRMSDNFADNRMRAELLGLDVEDIPLSLDTQKDEQIGAGSLAGSELSIPDLELTIRFRQLGRLIEGAYHGEELVSTCLALFSGGYYAYLTPTHKVPVATDLIKGDADQENELPFRTPAELLPNDYLIFREGMSSDLIRDTADLALNRGHFDVRRTAGLWREALQEFRKSISEANSDSRDPVGTRRTIAALRRGGLRRTTQTLRSWLNNEDNTIAPLYDDDIRLIAKITGYPKLCRLVEEVIEHGSIVRSAHRQAASHLARHLYLALRERISNVNADDITFFDVEDVGQAVVVQLIAIDDSFASVPNSVANRLLTEEKV